MVSNINFYWYGDIPEKSVLRNLATWVRYLSKSKSEFIVRLWTSEDIIGSLISLELGIEAGKYSMPRITPLKKEKLKFDGLDVVIDTYKFCDVRFNNIVVCDYDQFSGYYSSIPQLTKFYNYLNDNRLYVFASDIARLLIVNHFPGFYLDLDFLPNQEKVFFRNIDRVMGLFALAGFTLGPKDYYLYCLKSTFQRENALIINFHKGGIDVLIEEIENCLQKKITENNGPHYVDETEIYKEIFQGPKAQQLKNSFFKGEDNDYLKYYSAKNAEAFINKNEEDGFSILGRFRDSIEFIFSQTVFYSYFRTTYGGNFIHKEKDEYGLFYMFHIDKYFLNSQSNLPLYSWANPGFARLQKLDSATYPINKAFKNFLALLLRAFILKLEVMSFGINNTKNSVHNKIMHLGDNHLKKKFERLLKNISDSHKITPLNYEQAYSYLLESYKICTRIYANKQIEKNFLELLNTKKYSSLANIWKTYKK
ncbi:hypothetical protein EDC55_10535 [Allofrancisella inopinata]|uniref:Uncharacterized protein n=1 Tax=Allofrancisella inopinata TaxID=1085647 RepID=A0AAE7CQG0_9GAMM|nr:hypothetical protein [Allofrancisella inopinata]QIV95850.1 hypothetical protein E4K63_02990 [Allofrancisella inopinata]TDT72890.1 hypothetical protein EDC55_10535 [Allofrancisella inopinata]